MGGLPADLGLGRIQEDVKVRHVLKLGMTFLTGIHKVLNFCHGEFPNGDINNHLNSIFCASATTPLINDCAFASHELSQHLKTWANPEPRQWTDTHMNQTRHWLFHLQILNKTPHQLLERHPGHVYHHCDSKQRIPLLKILPEDFCSFCRLSWCPR